MWKLLIILSWWQSWTARRHCVQLRALQRSPKSVWPSEDVDRRATVYSRVYWWRRDLRSAAHRPRATSRTWPEPWPAFLPVCSYSDPSAIDAASKASQPSTWPAAVGTRRTARSRFIGYTDAMAFPRRRQPCSRSRKRPWPCFRYLSNCILG